MSETKLPAPLYTLWQAIITAHTVAQRALEEVRVLARLPGPPGEPGLGFDDFGVEHDGERGFVFRLVRGDLVKEWAFTVPAVIDKGVFKAETKYDRGDGVTYSGSFWIAQGETKGKPGELGSEGWRLAVKRGRDGKDGKNGERGPQGPEGKPGRDLTQMTFDGQKY